MPVCCPRVCGTRECEVSGLIVPWAGSEGLDGLISHPSSAEFEVADGMYVRKSFPEGPRLPTNHACLKGEIGIFHQGKGRWHIMALAQPPALHLYRDLVPGVWYMSCLQAKRQNVWQMVSLVRYSQRSWRVSATFFAKLPIPLLQHTFSGGHVVANMGCWFFIEITQIRSSQCKIQATDRLTRLAASSNETCMIPTSNSSQRGGA
ncbi:hypothetical protein F5B22DRAFT_465494 [Xylaria bambusicola]|uniref:uncharacterized protein n=1 Tax=Xylaria bambusicola TaxID=326684 RepID=UPI002007E665|nr:uncharacterized protein F5B22DRAFT_465494 [Xylaria bambusicola]KAI0522223.1 hypothetical protein F5B22DRAFT_465494 [Xylaria bambusicola]